MDINIILGHDIMIGSQDRCYGVVLKKRGSNGVRENKSGYLCMKKLKKV